MAHEPSRSIARDSDRFTMRQTVALAEQMLGRVWPNPAVGCVIERDGVVVARGATQPGGRPHAEAVALQNAGSAARGATVFVSLEPCDHWGKTPPCSEALIAAGVERVVIAVEDPDPRTNGGGVRRLRQAGIDVIVGVDRERAHQVNAGFFTRIARGRPLVAALHGEAGEQASRQAVIGGELRRDVVPLERFDALLADIQALRHSEPLARAPSHMPRVVLEPLAPSEAELRWLAAQPWPSWIVLSSRERETAVALRARGFEVVLASDEQTLAAAAGLASVDSPPPVGLHNPHPVLAALGDTGLTRVAVDAATDTARWLDDAALLDACLI